VPPSESTVPGSDTASLLTINLIHRQQSCEHQHTDSPKRLRPPRRVTEKTHGNHHIASIIAIWNHDASNGEESELHNLGSSSASLRRSSPDGNYSSTPQGLGDVAADRSEGATWAAINAS
jgi:hypothetical protein